VHVTGWREDGKLWIARRSALEHADPGKLDNLAAGGVVAGESPRRSAIVNFGKRPVCQRPYRTRRFSGHGDPLGARDALRRARRELVIAADISLPNSFQPIGRDGEVEEFLC
jgi:hypothetical protein